MKLNLPKLIRPIPLAEYAPEMEFQEDGKTPAIVYAWINPPAPLLARFDELRASGAAALEKIKGAAPEAVAAASGAFDEIAAGIHAVYAELWSQQADQATHWTVQDVRALANNSENPTLYSWLTGRTLQMIREHRSGLRKN